MQDQCFSDWRKCLVEFLYGVVQVEKMHIRILWLSLALFDRYSRFHEIVEKDMRLIGVTILVIASKLEEISSIDFHEAYCILDRKYTVMDFVNAEMKILIGLNFDLFSKNGYCFLIEFISLLYTVDEKQKHLAFYYAESNMKEDIYVNCSPALYAATSLFVALIDQTTHKTRDLIVWTEEHVKVTSFTTKDIFRHALIFLENLKKPLHCQGMELLSVQQKYMSSEFMAVATMSIPFLDTTSV